MIIYKVEAKHIAKVFPHVSELLQKAIDRTFGEINQQVLLQYLLSGQQQLWLGLNQKKAEIELAFTTEIYEFATGKKHLNMHLAGSVKHTVEDWWEDWAEPVEEFCREQGVDAITTSGRDGWTPRLKNIGYKKYYTVLIKEIDNAGTD